MPDDRAKKEAGIGGFASRDTGRVVGTLIGLAEAGVKFPGRSALLSVRDKRLAEKAKGGVKPQGRE
jgi:hypothetical protein